LGLVQRRDYDFVFTDLKMPGMDGLEVVKAVRHLRPDVDVAVITGYGTVESAVETMKHGAVDYVQKPFTEDELVEFARKLLIRRRARLESQREPSVRIVAPAVAETAAGHEYCVPGGAFVSGGHTWARIEPNGRLRTGLDDFARKALGAVEAVELPATGQAVVCGDPLFTVRRGSLKARFPAPMSGKVVEVNAALAADATLLTRSPYGRGWVCLIQPKDLAGELAGLKIGRPVADWYKVEIDRLRRTKGSSATPPPADDWAAFEQEFLLPVAAAR
jgi:glycine cleavage system H lipoate-binding protein